MESLFEIIISALESPLVIWITVAHVIFESVSIYDTRLIQWKKAGMIPQDTPTPPRWTGIFGIVKWITLITLLILNWKYALLLVVVIFLLKVIPVLEILGQIITYPLVKKVKN